MFEGEMNIGVICQMCDVAAAGLCRFDFQTFNENDVGQIEKKT